MDLKSKKVLLFTSSERGQANVVLATAQVLIERGCDVHIASFAPLAPRIEEIPGATFHQLHGESMQQALLNHFSKESDLIHGTGVREATRMYPLLMKVVCVWEGDEYIKGYLSAKKIIEDVKPDIIVVERLSAQAMDACKKLGRKFVVLSPNTYKETLVAVQPWGYGIWGWPADISGFPFPVPWYLIPVNIYLMIRLIVASIFSPRIKMISKIRNEAGLPWLFPFLEPYAKEYHYLIPTTLECDFACPNIPANVTSCGPILLPYPPIATVDPDLTKWLQARPTVLICQGSHHVADLDYATQQAIAVRILLEANLDIQVLWKLKMKGVLVSKEEEEDHQKTVAQLLSKEIADGRVRIERWLTVEPAALVESGHIVCSVHHGGANSYFESVSAGVPQIVLPVWYDTYDFAQRVEILGIGIYGNRSVAPRVDADGLSRALITITSPKNPAGKLLRDGAKELGKKMQKYGGRKLAAEKILELAEREEYSKSTVEIPK